MNTRKITVLVITSIVILAAMHFVFSSVELNTIAATAGNTVTSGDPRAQVLAAILAIAAWILGIHAAAFAAWMKVFLFVTNTKRK